MRRKTLAALVLALAAAGACSAIPQGGSPDMELAPLARSGKSKLGAIAVAPVATIALAQDELAKGWQAKDAFEARAIQKDLARGLELSASWDRVRLASAGTLAESWRERDDVVVSASIENVRARFEGHNGWWIPNLINFVLWVFPAWWVATEEYSLSFDLDLVISSGDSGEPLGKKRVPVKVTGTFDEFDRGWQLLGPISPSADADTWRNVVGLLLPAARRAAAAAVAREVDGEVRANAPSPSFQEARRKTLVLAIGVGRYADTVRLPPLAFAAEDARSFGDVLRSRGVPGDHVLVLADAEATTAAVTSSIADHLSRAREGDTVIFYFAGYGTRSANGEACLVFHDAVGEEGHLTLDALARLLSGTKGEKLLVVDAAFDGRGRSVAGGRRGGGCDFMSLEASPALAYIVAAGAHETALAPEHAEHGLLTEYLLQALSSGGGEEAARITARDLYNYARPRVVADAALLGERQAPLAGGLDRGFALERRRER